MEQKQMKRNKILFVVFTTLVFLLLLRVFYIQIICHDELTLAAESQYEVLVDGLDTRGMILDRNYMPLTGGTDQYYYFVDKNEEDQGLQNIVAAIDAHQIASQSSKYYVFKTEKYDEDINEILKEKYHSYVFQCDARYGDDQMACHLIGYLNEDEKVGVSGLELLYQEELEASNSNLYLWADAAGNLLTGNGPHIATSSNDQMRMLDNEGGIVTTVDRRIQYTTEAALKEYAKSGAAIVMDADSGEILAWTSMPTFNPNNIEEYLNSGSDCLINKVSQASYPPGSVFKIVTALAGLESGIDIEAEFDCTGSVEVEGITIGCTLGPDEGHGKVDMKKAMAVSCNCYFAKLGEAVGVSKILETADKMGLGHLTMEEFPEETVGNIPGNADIGAWDTSNISIGQGQLLVTPIQVCRMTAVIASGGNLIRPKIVLDEESQSSRVVTEENAQLIEGFLKSVMTEGTAAGSWELEVYGKTGTAEAGSYGEESSVCWFTGYCRHKEKKYVITVMVEDGTSGTADALPVFKRITDLLGKL